MRLDGTALEPGGDKYLILKTSAAEVVDDKFYRYCPEEVRPVKLAKTESCETVQANMQARLEKVRRREAEGTEFVEVSLQRIRGPNEIDGRDKQDAICLTDAIGIIAKKSRLNSEGLEPAGDAGDVRV